MHAHGRNQYNLGNPNVEQGISNNEVNPPLPFPSVFDIPYSTCPLCREADLRKICLSPNVTASVPVRKNSQGRRVFCGLPA
jgi:hypothetical protein